jgi:NAD(P)-dependent dehydrogenase (short-subunit alcohol dehydrogenase family)
VGSISGARVLEGKTAIVTGGGRGIGRAIAEALARSGAAVTVTARTEVEISEVVSGIRESGRRAMAILADVTDRRAVERMVSETERALGPVEILVNNAGQAGSGGALWEWDPDDWWRTGPMLCSRTVLPGMIVRRRGIILNVGSNAGVRPLPANTAYGTSKAALLRFSESLAAAVAEFGVRVFAVSPGLVKTSATINLPVFRNVPESDWRAADLVGGLIVRLAAGEADALSGCYLHVDDDLPALLRESERIRKGRLYSLRLLTLEGPRT